MRKIIAIGGGSIGNATKPAATHAIDQEIVRISGKKHPKMLFIPTASSDDVAYGERMKLQFGDRLGCQFEALHIHQQEFPYAVLKEKILGADIIYVGGGNTLMMMRRWRKLGIDVLLRESHDKGIVLCGLSAGSICWFKYGNSDSRKYKNPNADYIKVSGLNLIPILNCPHYDTEAERKPSLKNMMRKTTGVALAVDDCCALQVIGDEYRIISSKPGAHAYKVFWKNGEFFEQKLEPSSDFKPLKALLTK